MKRWRSRLDRLPSLRDSEPRSPKCKICGQPSPFFDAVDFNKYCGGSDLFRSDIAGVSVPYFRCGACDFTFTDFCDDWTNTDFANYIYNADYELVDPEYKSIRPCYNADRIAELLTGCETLRLLDYGAGSGQFAREMKKRGFSSVSSFDPFSSPIFPDGVFDIVCMLEVIEHVADPVAVLRGVFFDVLRPSGIAIVTQTVQPPDFYEVRGRWWYLGPRNGHISTFSERTFSKICHRLDLTFTSLGSGYYAFSRADESGGALVDLADPLNTPLPAETSVGPNAPTRKKHQTSKTSRGSSRAPVSA